MLSPANHPPRGYLEIFDADTVAQDLEKLAAAHPGRDAELRNAVAQRLKGALTQGRAAAEKLLLKERHGRHCAELLSFMQDEIIRVLYEFAAKHLYPSQNPSEAERMA